MIVQDNPESTPDPDGHQGILAFAGSLVLGQAASPSSLLHFMDTYVIGLIYAESAPPPATPHTHPLPTGPAKVQRKKLIRAQSTAMKSMRFQSVVLAMAGSLGIALGLLAATPARTAPKYDGHWWLSVSSDEQSGFLNGYFDCYTYEYRGHAKFTINPPDIARALVTKFYEGNPSRLGEPVGSVFYGLRDRPGEKSTATDGQPISGRHGYYRGLYWGELYHGGTSGQLGYVEGYLDCHARLNHNKGGVFSKPPADYVNLINRWYGFIPHNEAYLLKRESTPIVDVLFKFRDPPQRAKPGNKQ